MKTEFIEIIILAFISGVIAGWFLFYFIKRNKKEVKKQPFQFFHKDKLYVFDEINAIVLMIYDHGMDYEYRTTLVKFNDGKFFSLEFNNFGAKEEIKKLTKEEMIKKLRRLLQYFPKKALASLKLLE